MKITYPIQSENFKCKEIFSWVSSRHWRHLGLLSSLRSCDFIFEIPIPIWYLNASKKL